MTVPAAPPELPAELFRSKLAAWFKQHARQLPWRGIHDPYATWLSEIMLQQTRVATVIDRYGEFLRRFPTIEALAAAPEDDVLALWSGLGYYRRARMLHRGAQFVVRELEGKLPRTAAELRTLPGVGEYTAAAIASIAFGESIAVVDGNVERVLLRVLGLVEDRASARRARVYATAQALAPTAAGGRRKTNPPGDHNQALMELGATVCLPRQPLCLQCPVMAWCRTRGEHPTPPRGQAQSRLVAHLLAIRKKGTATEVLLERRPADASLMPGMLELPPLPMDAVAGREPVLRLRHAIINTNYAVEVYSEGAQGSAPEQIAEEVVLQAEGAVHAQGVLAVAREEHQNEDEAVFDLAEMREEPADGLHPRSALELPLGAPVMRVVSLLQEIPASPADLEWTPVGRLREVPLTGLARKCLQRLRVMSVDLRALRSGSRPGAEL